MATIVSRAVKSSALTFTEMDQNFSNLNSDKIELTNLSVGTEGSASGDGSIAYNNTTGVFTYTPPTAAGIGAAALTGLSVTTAADGETAALSYNNTTGVFTFTPVVISDLIALTDLSVGTEGAASGDGAIAYNNTTGVFAYTPPDLSSYLTSETFTSVVQDTTPQLGGNLDVQASGITTTTTDGDLSLSANGTGSLTVGGGVGINLLAANKIFTNTAATDIDFDATGYLNFNTPVTFYGGIAEELNVSATTTGTYAPASADGSIHYVVLTGSMTINAFTDPVSGQTITFFFDGTGGSYTLTLGANILTPGGTLALTDGGYDLVTITCLDDATPVYIATAVNDFQ